MTGQILNSKPTYRSLMARWGLVALFSFMFLLGGYGLLRAGWHHPYALRWVGLTALGLTYLLWNLWRGLKYNHRQGEERLLAGFGPGNSLTILRGVMIAGLAGFIFSPRPAGWLAWGPGVLYTLGALIDLFDGYAARRADHSTLMGEKLDMALDGLGLLTAAALAVWYGQLPLWYLAVGLARYLFLVLSWIRRRRGLAVHPLPDSAIRRPLAGAQMGFVAVMLWPVFTPPVTYIAALLFALPFLSAFTLDGLAVSGIFRPEPGGKDVFSSGSARLFLTRWLPLALRALAVSLLAAALAEIGRTFFALSSEIPGASELPLEFGMVFPLLLEGLGMILLALGAAGRFGAVTVLFAQGLRLRSATLDSTVLILMLVSAALFFLGSGAFSLWKPEDGIISRRLGEA